MVLLESPQESARDFSGKEPLKLPFKIIADDREQQAGWKFAGMIGDYSQKYHPIDVEMSYRRIKTGDYTIDTLENIITIERKTLSDYYQSCTQERGRFEQEFARMQAMVEAGGFAVVIVEGNLTDEPPTAASPDAIFSTAIKWHFKYRVPVLFAGSRERAELAALRYLTHFFDRWETDRREGALAEMKQFIDDSLKRNQGSITDGKQQSQSA